MSINHSAHEHPLFFVDIKDEMPSYYCSLCNRSTSLPVYACRTCKFLLHVACVELPDEIPCPSHPFQTIKRLPLSWLWCHSCDSGKIAFPFQCDSCGFKLCFQCVFFKEEKEEEDCIAFGSPSERFTSSSEEEWKAFRSPSGRFTASTDVCWIGIYRGIRCSLCDETCEDVALSSAGGDYFVHESCTARWIHHPSHRSHPLKVSEEARTFTCNGCLEDDHRRRLHFECTDCDYHLHYECAYRFEGCQLVNLDVHPHLLVVTEENKGEKDGAKLASCVICRERCSSGQIYSCLICDFCFHGSCFQSGEIRQHPTHPFHPLKKSEQHEFKCHACLSTLSNSTSYCCEECDFEIDFDCAYLVPPQKLQHKEPILSNIHRHPLALRSTGGRAEPCCALCHESCSFPTHSCGVCDIFVHKSCATANLLEDVPHPLFQGHSLQISLGSFRCSVCLRDRSNSVHYRCTDQECDCEVSLDVGCASDIHRPLITFDGHKHPLIFLESFDGGPDCSACSKPCKSSSPMFHCATCSFNLHLLCSPLPCSLKQETHLDILVLKDSHIEDHMNDEFYCDSCEETRNPEECVYYCDRCFYCAEIKCVMPELALALMGKSGDGKLRTIGRWSLPGKVATRGLSVEEVQELYLRGAGGPGRTVVSLKSLTEDDKVKIDSLKEDALTFSCSDDEFLTLMEYCLDPPDILREGSRDICSRDDGNYVSLGFKIEHVVNDIIETRWDTDIPVILVGDNLVPEKFVHVYNDLYQKYGDLGSRSELSPRVKAMFLLCLCETVERMWAVKVKDITEEDLKQWWCSSWMLKTAGFDMEFSVDALKTSARAKFGSSAEIFEANLEGAIGSLEKKIKKMQALQRGIEGKLERRKKDLQDSAGRYSNVEERIREAAFLKNSPICKLFLGQSLTFM